VTARSFERLLKTSRLLMSAPREDAFVADRTIRLTGPDQERLEGKVREGARASGGGGSSDLGLAKKLGRRLKMKAPRASAVRGARAPAFTPHYDMRQRAVAKIHYFNHAGTGGAALKAHGKYIARDAGRGGQQIELPEHSEAARERAGEARAPADHLERGGKPDVFYDAASQGVDGVARLENWARSDLRHFRIILSLEEGARLRDLPAYTREVMARAGAALGAQLSWVAVDHRDTDNVHTHIVVRGRRANGQDLVLPRDFIKHGFRSLAQDVATEWLGRRTPEQERAALERDVRRHAPSRLDKIIAGQARDGRIELFSLQAPNGDPALTQAAKARVQELARMGLAEETKRGVFRLAPDWRDRLQALELHLDVRKRVMRERIERGLDRQRLQQALRKGLMDR
jgi:type IV secretory pathway VirD2 relaxase